MMNLERNFKFTEPRAHSDLHYPPFLSVPHLTYGHTSIYCSYAFFSTIPLCVCEPYPWNGFREFQANP